jgi:hypothetical protein
MEDDPHNILSPLLDKPQIQKQFEELDRVVKEASKRIDFAVAHDPEILKAIDIVERFLRRSRRVCYGGQAINALLPRGRKFYDEKYTIPDYDFFTPFVHEDVSELMKILEKEGFNVSKKVGVHEGTMKVLVNFVPIADCSDMNKQLFKILQKRATSVNGILYCDPDFLRMMMYLELSRPRGQVERWRKVYERLTLLNNSYPLDKCDEDIVTGNISHEDRKNLLDFCVKHKRVMAGPEFIEIMEKKKTRTHFDTLVNRGGPVIFLSHQAELDAEDLRVILGMSQVQIKVENKLSDQLFTYVVLKRRNKVLAIIFQEDACHAYTLLKIDANSEMRVGTPDLYLHLYYSLMIFGKKEKAFFQNSLECLIQKLFEISDNARSVSAGIVPSFGLRCSGRQKGMATLLKERVERTEKEKGKKVHSNTKEKGNAKGKTRKNRKTSN